MVDGSLAMAINADRLDLLFRTARSHRSWPDRPMTDDVLRQL
jgi:hypothetical protein